MALNQIIDYDNDNNDLKIRIEDLIYKLNVEDGNLLVVEDSEDTKKTTLLDLKKSITGDYTDPSSTLFYSSEKVQNIKEGLELLLRGKANQNDLDSLSRRVADIIANSGSGKDSELVDARDGQASLNTRLKRDYDNLNNNKLSKIVKEDQTVDTQYLLDHIEELENHYNSKIDKCNLMENYGEYVFFNNIVSKNTDVATYAMDSKFNRNGTDSLRVIQKSGAASSPYFTTSISIDAIESATLLFYVSKKYINDLSSTNIIRVILGVEPAQNQINNYFFIDINGKDLINGWNFFKKTINEFGKVGNPTARNIKTVKIELTNSSIMQTKEFYFNSIIFNQRMKPTLLLNFNGVYGHGREYTYPYLYSRKIPCTLFFNNSVTMDTEMKNYILGLRVNHDWDFGLYGCHPDKDVLTGDENQIDQYMCLRDSLKYLNEYFIYNPISYSAPYGNIRPITEPILKEMGFKIARVETDNNRYCPFFSKEDMFIPVISINNKTTLDNLKDCIDYAIETGQTISLFTNNITEYGDDANAKQIIFEDLMEYIIEKINAGQLQCMTYKDFYNRCTE